MRIVTYELRGQCTVEEFNDRSAQAFEARTGDQLPALFDDLPPVATWPPPGQTVPVMPAGPVNPRPSRGLSRGRTVAVCIVGYFLAGNLLGAVASLATHDWGNAIGTIVPAVVLSVIFLALLRPVFPPRRS